MGKFAVGLKKDLSAVRAGLTEPWSNGPVEGFVNKLKLVKRQGYGRAARKKTRRFTNFPIEPRVRVLVWGEGMIREDRR